MAEPTDRDLVILTRQGDKEAFCILMERYQVLAERIALRMLGAADAAQDLVQEAMLQAYLSIRDLQKEDSFRSWLYGIVMNVSKSYLREQTRRWRLDGELDDEHPGDASDDPQVMAVENELHHLVLTAIADLPRAHRETALLYYYESLTLHEVAAITGASAGATRVRLHRARNHLREKLSRIYPDIGSYDPKPIRRKPMIHVKIADIVKHAEQFTVILQEEGQEKFLPIWIGPFEGRAIAIGLRAFPVNRPETYDFIVHLLGTLGAQLVEVQVVVLKGAIFYGIAKLRLGDEVKEVDARPSDVLALAVRTGCPIYVSAEVMEQAGVGREALEKQIGPIHVGEGVEEILKEIEKKQKELMAILKDLEEAEEKKE